MKSKMLTQIKLIIFILIIVQNLGLACFCPYEPVFCKNVHVEHNLIQAVVTDSTNQAHTMEVEILENIHKEITEDTLLIHGRDLSSCGERLDQFSINDTLILAIEILQFNGNEYWYLGGECGLQFLRYENGILNGQITESLTTQPIQDFKDDIFACIDLTVPVKEIESLENQITVFPNPTLGNFQISFPEIKVSSYEIYNSSGQQVINETLNEAIDIIEVKSSPLSNGIYYLRLITSKGILTRKFLKI